MLPNIFMKNRPALLPKVLPIFLTKIGPVTYFEVLPIKKEMCTDTFEKMSHFGNSTSPAERDGLRLPW